MAGVGYPKNLVDLATSLRPFVDFNMQTTTITWMPYACGSLNVDQTGCSRKFTRAVDFWVDKYDPFPPWDLYVAQNHSHFVFSTRSPDNATYTLDPARIPRDIQDRNNYLQ